MSLSRRSFMQWAASASTLAVAGPGAGKLIPLFKDALGRPTGPGLIPGFRPNLLPTQKEVWDQVVWMTKLGPRFAGNKAHITFVNFLASQVQALGLEVTRDTMKMPLRWEARSWGLNIIPASGQRFKAPVTSYFPWSGQTSAEGVTGELVYAGKKPSFNLSGLQGKVALIEVPMEENRFYDYEPWGVYPPVEKFPTSYSPARAPLSNITQFQKAGAVGVILVWTNISDANAADQYTPFCRDYVNIPALYVGRKTGAKLKAMAGSGTKATVMLEADLDHNSPTDHIIATLPGTSTNEFLIVNTHTDGTNAVEENAGLGLVALAKYFSQIPKAQRNRTIAFVFASGHMSHPYVNSIDDIIRMHPELIKKTVAAMTIEHMGCREWLDDALLNYKATGKNEWGVAYSRIKSLADVTMECLKGSGDVRTASVNPRKGHWHGEGRSLSDIAKIPTIGYIPGPNYLCAAPANGCIEKVDPGRIHSEIEVFAKIIHKLDTMAPEELRGQQG